MSLLIPTRSDLPYFDLQVTLDSVTYTLTFRWNVRAAAWFVGVASEDGQTVYTVGSRLVADFPFLLRRTGRQPAGWLLCADTSGQGLDPGIADLGTRCQVFYLTAADLGLAPAGAVPVSAADAAALGLSGAAVYVGPRGLPGAAGAVGPAGPAGVGGHTLVNDATALPARSKIRVDGTLLTLTDDAANDRTLLGIGGSGYVQLSPGSPQTGNIRVSAGAFSDGGFDAESSVPIGFGTSVANVVSFGRADHLMQFYGYANFSGGVSLNSYKDVTDATSSPFQILDHDTVVNVHRSASAVVLYLPMSGFSYPYKLLVIKDTTGNCSAVNTITLAIPPPYDVIGRTIDGGVTKVLSLAGAGVLLYNDDWGNWHTLAEWPSGDLHGIGDASATPYAVADAENVVEVALAPCTVNLPYTGYANSRVITITDVNGLASIVTPITVAASGMGGGLDRINGATTQTITTAFGSLTLRCGSAYHPYTWNIIGRGP